MVKIVGLTFNN